ncbi:eukaryotic porin-domain-containing protein [Lipomyces arxii]|uniref:eukaryotic porin-domain-containing protein n=1 Tax=Lipomyces arxii TaxID=56418 RepID=UPI0034CD780D
MANQIESFEDKQLDQIQRGLLNLSFGNLAPLSSNVYHQIRQAPGVSHVLSFYDKIAKSRADQGLTTPLKLEDYSREIEKDILTTYYMNQGLRADINQTINIKPLFNIAHSFAVGASRDVPYHFTAVWGSDNHFLRGGLDTDLTLNAIGASRLSENVISRFQAYASDRALQVHAETDFIGPDFILTLRTTAPSVMESKFTGALGMTFSQSITKKLSLGLTGNWARQQVDYPANASFDFGGRYEGENYIASAGMTAQGSINLGFVQTLTPQVTAGVLTTLDLTGMSDMEAMMSGKPPTPSGSTQVGVKTDFPDGSTIRAQVDLSGKLSFALDKIVAGIMKITISSELDQAKGTSKVGLGLQLESQTSSVMELSQRLQALDPELARTFMSNPPQ